MQKVCDEVVINIIAHLQEQQMGPGKYHLPDFIDEISSRAASTRGICDSRGPRLRGENKVVKLLVTSSCFGRDADAFLCPILHKLRYLKGHLLIAISQFDVCTFL